MKNYKVVVVGNPSSLKNSLIRSIVSEKKFQGPTSVGNTDFSTYTVNQTNFDIFNCVGKLDAVRDAKLAIIVEGGEDTPTPSDYKTSITKLTDDIPIHIVSGSFEGMKEQIVFIFGFYSGTFSTLLDN